jgi:hypothetical protein
MAGRANFPQDVLSIDHAIPVDGRISMSRLLSNAASRLGAQAL